MRASLNGFWDYRIGEGPFSKNQVPFSKRCVGQSTCVLEFDRHEITPRAFLVFEGITYQADVTFNGSALGHMLPYCEYRFEITHLLKDKGNQLCVKLQDLGLPFGPSAGWENYGGIIRDVYIDYAPASVISNIEWHSFLNEDNCGAECYITPQVDPADNDLIFTAELLDVDGTLTAAGSSRNGETVTFTIQSPKLWSPDAPALYTLRCMISANGEVIDCKTQRVGIKDFRIKDRRFYLNGKPLFLLGVNRHDTCSCIHSSLRGRYKGAVCPTERCRHYNGNHAAWIFQNRSGGIPQSEGRCVLVRQKLGAVPYQCQNNNTRQSKNRG